MRNIFKNQFAIVIFTIFLDGLGFGILIPIIPLLLTDSASTFYILPPGVSVETGYILLGLITAIFPLMQLFSTSILGQLSDKFGRKVILKHTLVFTAVSYALFAVGIMTKNIPLLFISRAMAGISSGNLAVAQAAIADLTEPKDRAKNFGLMGAAFGISFIVGPFIGGKLSDPSLLPFFGPTVPFWFATILSLLNTFFVRFYFIETNKFIDSTPKVDWIKSIHNIVNAFKYKNLRLLYLTNFLFFSGFTFFVTFISVLLIQKFHFTQGDNGNYFSFIGIWIALTQIFITPRLAKHFSEWQILTFTITIDGILIGLLYLAPQAWIIYLLSAGIAICNGLTIANITGLISRSAEAKIQGEILGISASISALAQLIPPIASGFIAANTNAGVPLIVAAVVIVISGILFTSAYKPLALAKTQETTDNKLSA